MAELLGLAAACFLAATLVPLPSEGALLVYLHFHPGHTAAAIALATAANTAGGMTSYLIGRLIPQKAFNPRALSWCAATAPPPPSSLFSRSSATPYASPPDGCA